MPRIVIKIPKGDKPIDIEGFDFVGDKCSLYIDKFKKLGETILEKPKDNNIFTQSAERTQYERQSNKG